MRARVPMTGVILIAVALTGCTERSARSAVDTAERQLDQVREQASRIAPQRLQALSDSLEAIKARMAEGDHRSALMSARSVSALARDLSATLENTRSQLQSAFTTAQNEIPGQLQAVQARVSELAAMRRLPQNVNAAAFATVRTESAQWPAMWDEAQKGYADGNLAAALAKANELRRALGNARSVLGME
jgi:hypothetical protein